jgi:hypothetical protein
MDPAGLSLLLAVVTPPITPAPAPSFPPSTFTDAEGLLLDTDELIDVDVAMGG